MRKQINLGWGYFTAYLASTSQDCQGQEKRTDQGNCHDQMVQRDRTTKCTAGVHQVSSRLDSGIQSLLDIDRYAVYSYLSDIYMWEIRRPIVNAVIYWQLGNLSKRNIGIF